MFKTALSKKIWVLFSVSLLGVIVAVSEFVHQGEVAKTGGVEYHFLLDLNVNLQESSMGQLNDDVIAKFQPLFQITNTPGPMAKIFYYDSDQRITMKSNLIFRVSEEAVTVKSRSSNPKQVMSLPICSRRKQEIDVFSGPEYSISSYVNYLSGEFNSNPAELPTFLELKNYITSKCPDISVVFDHSWDLNSIYSPGIVHEYSYPIALSGNHPSEGQVEKVNFSIWFMTPTDKVIAELAFTTISNPNEELVNRLRKDTTDLLKANGVLHPNQSSKTELYFSAYKK